GAASGCGVSGCDTAATCVGTLRRAVWLYRTNHVAVSAEPRIKNVRPVKKTVVQEGAPEQIAFVRAGCLLSGACMVCFLSSSFFASLRRPGLGRPPNEMAACVS